MLLFFSSPGFSVFAIITYYSEISLVYKCASLPPGLEKSHLIASGWSKIDIHLTLFIRVSTILPLVHITSRKSIVIFLVYFLAALDLGTSRDRSNLIQKFSRLLYYFIQLVSYCNINYVYIYNIYWVFMYFNRDTV